MVSGSQLQVAKFAQMCPAAHSGAKQSPLPDGAPSSTKISLEPIIILKAQTHTLHQRIGTHQFLDFTFWKTTCNSLLQKLILVLTELCRAE